MYVYWRHKNHGEVNKINKTHVPDGSKIGGISSKRNENMDIMATKILNRGKSREYIFSEIRETHLEIYTCSLLNSDNDIEKKTIHNTGKFISCLLIGKHSICIERTASIHLV